MLLPPLHNNSPDALPVRPIGRSAALGLAALLLSACGSKQPTPEVAVAYSNKFGAVTTSRATACPAIEGVWHLAKLSQGTFELENGQAVEHMRWFAPMLFGLSVSRNSYIGVEPRRLETVLYLSTKLPGQRGDDLLGYHIRTDAEIPCVGAGWRRVGVTDQSGNHAAVRVLEMEADKPAKVVQVDYLARTDQHELVLASRIDFEGSDRRGEAVKGGYWHFVKMPRVNASTKERGFKAP